MLLETGYLKPGEKQVVVIGGGFGGLATAQRLANKPGLHVILADQRNYHLFQPLLYQVATAALNPADIAVPIRSEFAKAKNVAVHLKKVERVDLAAKHVIGEDGDWVAFDYLVLATGAQHSYFGHPEWEPFAPGLKTLEQATEIRRRILLAFEEAENEGDPVKQRALLTFVVVGGGATGLELAGAISDIARTVLVRDFRRINPASARVLLIEAGPRLIAAFSPTLGEHAAVDLTKLGVEVQCNTRVQLVDAEGVTTNEGRIPARSVFWAAGVQASALGKSLGVPLDKAGRIPVGPDLSIPGHPDVFVIGDLAHFDLGDGKLLPGVAPAAIQTGRCAADNILASIHKKARRPFHYLDKGQMATIGKAKAVAQTGKLKLTGFIAWLAWLFVHVLYLVGFRSRFAVIAEWSWSYIFSKRGARLITSKAWQTQTPHDGPAERSLPGPQARLPVS